MKIDYSLLKVGDRVDYSGKSPLAIGIRLFTAGIKRMFDKTVPTHTGIVCKWEGQFVVAGMRNKIAIESLDHKEICGIYRPKCIDDHTRSSINREIALDVRRSLEYDTTGMLSNCIFLSWLKENKRKFYCSEYYAWLALPVKSRVEKISPFDLYEMDCFDKII